MPQRTSLGDSRYSCSPHSSTESQPTRMGKRDSKTPLFSHLCFDHCEKQENVDGLLSFCFLLADVLAGERRVRRRETAETPLSLRADDVRTTQTPACQCSDAGGPAVGTASVHLVL